MSRLDAVAKGLVRWRWAACLGVGCLGFGCAPGRAGEANTPESAEAVQGEFSEEAKVWEAFRRHVGLREGAQAAQMVSDADLEPFAIYRTLALTAPRTKLEAISPWFSVPALSLRALTTRVDLEAMGPREVFAILVDQTRMTESWPQNLTVHKHNGTNLFADLGPHVGSSPILRLGEGEPTVALVEIVAADRWALRKQLGLEPYEVLAPDELLAEAARWVGKPSSQDWWNELAPNYSPAKKPQADKRFRLPSEVIQGTIRSSFFPLRLCYEDGLDRNPQLSGRISVRFVIDRSGRSTVASADSDIPDQGVNDCIKGFFSVLVFPKPEGGIVTVTYPIRFEPR